MFIHCRLLALAFLPIAAVGSAPRSRKRSPRAIHRAALQFFYQIIKIPDHALGDPSGVVPLSMALTSV